jgi:extracellular factor (EF) 3-hydroxypalmitic acid methyl ester biosynthesis protein
MINAYALQLPPILAHRNRITFLTEQLIKETVRVANERRQARIYTLGCGPAQEVQRFLAKDGVAERADFTLVDFNEETLAHTNQVLSQIKSRNQRGTSIKLLKQSVQQILKQADRVVHQPADQYDFVYCAGLFDYLSDKVCRKLMDIFYEMVAPGGLLLATNVDLHPAVGEMECFLEWHLVHRNTEQMWKIAPTRTSQEQISLLRDTTGVNVFMCVRKN